jgi:shikimate dehydrogenase
MDDKPLVWGETADGRIIPGRDPHHELFHNKPADKRPYIEIIGQDAERSKLAPIYRFWIEKCGMTVDVRCTIPESDDALELMKRRTNNKLWAGANVSGALRKRLARAIPRFPGVEEIDTIFRLTRLPMGTSTQVAGLWEGLKHYMKDADSRANAGLFMGPCQILGADGQAYMLLRHLKEKGLSNFWVYDQDVGKARDLCAEFSLPEERAQPLTSLAPLPTAMWTALNPGGFHFVINNLEPPGADGSDRPPLGPYPPGSLFASMMNDPADARLLRLARDGGLTPLDPVRCLIGSAATNFTLMFMREPPRKHDEELIELLESSASGPLRP